MTASEDKKRLRDTDIIALCSMNPIKKLRMKNSKKAVTPVIATIILIAATIVLALVVGAYTFGLFGSNVKTVTLSSANLLGGSLEPSKPMSPCNYTGEAYATLSLSNPGPTTNVTSFSLTSSSLAGEMLATYFVPPATVSSSSTTCILGVLCGPTRNSPIASCLMLSSNGGVQPQLAGGSVSTIAFHFENSTNLLSGQPFALTNGELFSYVVSLANGQSISGPLIVQ